MRLAREKKLFEISELIEEIEAIKMTGITPAKAHSIIKDQKYTLLEYLFVNESLKTKSNGFNLISNAIEIDNSAARVRFVQLMLANGMGPNGEPNDKGYPLIAAIKKNDITTAGLLLQAGANPNIVDENQKTPLMYTAEKLHLSIAKLLIDQYAARPQLEVSTGVNSYELDACFELPDKGYIFFRRLDVESRIKRSEFLYLMNCFQD